MDDDDERRGRPTVHIAFDEAIAILAGDGLLTQAFGTLAELGPRAADAVRVLARRAGSRELLAGQAIDLRSPPRTLAEIERMHAAKTGALFAAAGELGAIAAGASSEICALPRPPNSTKSRRIAVIRFMVRCFRLLLGGVSSRLCRDE